MKQYIGKITDDRVMSCSRLAALAGLSPYSMPNDELRKSIAAIDAKATVAPGAFTSSEPAHWGNLHEGNILQEIVTRLALEDAELEITEPSLHKTLPLQGSLDGRANGCGLTFTTDASAGIYVIGQDEITLNGTGVLEAKSTRHMPELDHQSATMSRFTVASENVAKRETVRRCVGMGVELGLLKKCGDGYEMTKLYADELFNRVILGLRQPDMVEWARMVLAVNQTETLILDNRYPRQDDHPLDTPLTLPELIAAGRYTGADNE